MSASSLAWYHKNRERIRQQKAADYRRNKVHRLAKSKEWQVSVRARLFAVLGNACACCGESRRTMLEIDHIHNDGNVHRRLRKGWSLYVDILRDDNPGARFQILCSNCNRSKQFNGGTCEHKTETAPSVAHGEFP